MVVRTSQLLFVNELVPEPKGVNEIYLIDKFTLIAKLRLVCQMDTSKWHLHTDLTAFEGAAEEVILS